MPEISSADHMCGWATLQGCPPRGDSGIQLLSSCGSASSTHDHHSHYQRKTGQEGCPGCFEGPDLMVAYIISTCNRLTKSQSHGPNPTGDKIGKYSLLECSRIGKGNRTGEHALSLPHSLIKLKIKLLNMYLRSTVPAACLCWAPLAK